ncbi:MAG: hypothetical protein Q9188_005898 [Gyalolechia gomerana]
MFLQRLWPNTNRTDVLEVAHVTGGLPLDIFQLAAFIRRGAHTFTQFLELYRDDLNRKEFSPWFRLQRGNLASTWASKQLEPAAEALLEICAVLHHDSIKESIFISSIPNEDFLRGLLRSRDTYSSALRTLLRGSLIKRKREVLSIDRIFQDLLRSRLDSQHETAVLSAAIHLVDRAWGSTLDYLNHVSFFDKDRWGLVRHITRLKGILEKRDGNLNTSTRIQLTRLLVEAGWWLHEKHYSSKTEPPLDPTLDIGDYYLGKDIDNLLFDREEINHLLFHSEEVNHLFFDIHLRLSSITSETNRATQSLQHAKRLLDICTGPQSGIRLAIAHNQLGVALCLTYNYDAAKDQFNNSIKTYKELSEYWDGMDIDPRVNLGFVYWYLGDLTKANQILEDCLQTRESETRSRKMDLDPYSTGRLRHALGNVRLDQERFQESEKLHETALQQYEMTRIRNKAADLCHKVAQHCVRKNEYDKAMQLIEQALRTWRIRELFHAPEIARTMFLKSIVREKQGIVKEAKYLAEDARQRRNRILSWARIVKGEKMIEKDKKLTEKDLDKLAVLFSR